MVYTQLGNLSQRIGCKYNMTIIFGELIHIQTKPLIYLNAN
jgi:hypothetical protein